ncbi:hypothetical protein [uncultured Roseobacter sp.]|uniref:hypothetical protein n=2 Tax=uncultured Roseobacter sp. TaxID=114847 RepID=UPI0026065BF2|nr:hypothetical protein [uncultured Roseobacter sp.]
MFRSLLFYLILFTPLPAAAAQGVLYDCTMTQLSRGGGWISEKIGIALHENGRVTVSDRIILRSSSVPIDADRVRKTDRKLVVNWVLRDFKNSDSQTTSRFNFDATIRKDGKITVYARPSGYRNRFSGTGTCTTRKP